MCQARDGLWMRRRIAGFGSLLCLAGTLAAPPAVSGEAPDLLSDPFNLALGTFILETDTEVRLDGESGRGTQIDWEQTLGEGDATRFRFDGTWRFAERHKLRALWFNNSVSQSRRLDRDISWGDVVYPADAEVDSDFEFDVYELAYEYVFLKRDRYELSGTIGLHYTDLSLAIEGEGTVGGQPVAGDVREEGSVDAPLPVIGLRGLWNLTHAFWLDASAQFFALSIDDIDGNLQDYRFAVLWQPKPWLGVGIGYNQFTIDVDVEKTRFDGSLDWTYRGPMLFYSASF
jgi:hypothetical protein